MKKISFPIAMIALSIALPSFAGLFSKDTSPPESMAQKRLPDILRQAMKSVVNVNVEEKVPDVLSETPPIDDNNGNKLIKLGSGVITQVDKNKTYIVTNAHVVTNDSAIEVTLNDNRRFTAKKIGEDRDFDLAVLEITTLRPNNLVALPYGDSNKAEIGESVSAIGSPFGFHQSASTGIISGTNRDEPAVNRLTNYLQTDAPINPGNSGGALIDSTTGKLMGINTWIVSKDGGSLGIGFAIPANIVKAVANQIIHNDDHQVEHGQLGIMVQSLNPELAASLGKSEGQRGAIVTEVKPGTPAKTAGLKTGDIITKFDKDDIHSSVDLIPLIDLNKPGKEFTLKVLRGNTEHSLSMTTELPKQLIEQQQQENPYLFGMTLRDFKFSTIGSDPVSGISILDLAEQSNAANAGLAPGDIIIAANETPVSDIKTLLQDAKDEAQKPDGILLLTIKRGNGTLFIPISKDQTLAALGDR